MLIATPPFAAATLAFFNFSPWELLIIAVIALLLFGRRLPEVGKSLGKGIVEFKRGLSGVEDEVKAAGGTPPPSQWAQQSQSLPPTGQTAPPMAQGQPHTVARDGSQHA